MEDLFISNLHGLFFVSGRGVNPLGRRGRNPRKVADTHVTFIHLHHPLGRNLGGGSGRVLSVGDLLALVEGGHSLDEVERLHKEHNDYQQACQVFD